VASCIGVPLLLPLELEPPDDPPELDPELDPDPDPELDPLFIASGDEPSRGGESLAEHPAVSHAGNRLTTRMALGRRIGCGVVRLIGPHNVQCASRTKMHRVAKHSTREGPQIRLKPMTMVLRDRSAVKKSKRADVPRNTPELRFSGIFQEEKKRSARTRSEHRQ